MDETFDFVVVGSGGGSMCAGLVMHEAGKSVLILEKTQYVGGSTAKAGGVMWIPNNRFMKEAGIKDSVEQATAYLDAVVGDHNDTPGASRERRAAYLREAPEMIEFLVRQGIELTRVKTYPDYYNSHPGGSIPGRTVVAKLFDVNELGEWRHKLRPNVFPYAAPLGELMQLPMIKVSWRARWYAFKLGLRTTFQKLAGKRVVTAGNALQGRMLKASIKAGLDIRIHAGVSELILDDVGAVIGVVTEKDGKPWRVGARLGVLLNAGGFAHDQAMRDKYIPHTKTSWSFAAEGDTGDMHRELIRIGAAMAQMEELIGSQNSLPPGAEPSAMQKQIANPHAFMVDRTGVRYMREACSYMEFCQLMLARHETVPAVPSWMIFDSQYMRKYMLATSMPGTSKPREWYESGFLRKGETIEELAIACDIPPATLAATVDRFNLFARQGRDDDFQRGDRFYDDWLGDLGHKPSPSLGTVEKGPFFAVQIVPGDVGTFGGAVCDAHARVLRQDGSVIPGLYATGTTSAAVMGRTYPGAGCSIGPSFTWGYVAAKHAANADQIPVH